MLTRLGARCLLGGGRSLAALCALGLGAGCAVDSLDRLGAGNALVRQEPDASAEPPLDVPLRPDALELDAGAATQLAPPSHALVPSDSDAGDGIPELSGELLPNPGFEQGHEGWFGLGPSRIFDVVDAHGGSRAILSTNRAATWDGPAYDITALIEAERAYAVSLWVRNELDTQMVMLTLKSVCSGQSTYARLATRVVGTEWLQLTSGFFVPPCATALEGLTLYVEGPPAFKNLLVDDASLRAVMLLTHRLASWLGDHGLFACNYTGDQKRIEAATLVSVTSRQANDALFLELKADEAGRAAAGIKTFRNVGDSDVPGAIVHAVYAGHKAAREFGEVIDPDVFPFKRELVFVK